MDFSTKTGTAKTVLSFIVGSGCYKATGDILRSHFVVESGWDRLRFVATSFAVGGIIADSAKEYTDKSVDEAISIYHQAKDAIDKYKAEQQVTPPEAKGP